MNSQLIEKIIKTYNEKCPEIVFTNPLLDCEVSKALSKSFVKIITAKPITNVNSHLRLSVLENIRRICKLEPEGHLKVEENVTELLIDFYNKQIADSLKVPGKDNDKQLDAFLIRHVDSDIKSHFQLNLDPEVIQALNNLNQNVINLSENLIHLNALGRRGIKTVTNIRSGSKNEKNDTAIKIKCDIEHILFNAAVKVLENKDIKVSNLLNEDIISLFKHSAESSTCFQICSNILNMILISSNFNGQIQDLITEFVRYVKLYCKEFSLSALYRINLQHIVILLDVNLQNVPESIGQTFHKSVRLYLNKLQNESEIDLILLLSHFPQWFDIYFSLR
ncbi:unnamed protein product [Leptidea sinapis]|uniref:Uncharacterized protein n=1 Tax=Leptidea sinapis TaxID=189913 RepID=A0A5E4QLY3_9NEOP|nr:unnamed protein product [Leptidea sinapis]